MASQAAVASDEKHESGSGLVAPPDAPICGNCKQFPSVIHCQDCQGADPDYLCETCDAVIHKARTKRKHVRAPLISSGGQFLNAFGMRGRHLPFGFDAPSQMALDIETNIMIISDTNNHRVQAVHLDSGMLLWSHGQTLEFGDDVNQLYFPRGVAFSADNRFVYVVDSGNHRVCLLRSDNGARIWAWGSHGIARAQFSQPWGLAVWKDRVWVSDNNNHRAQGIQASDGVYLREVGEVSNEGSSEKALMNQPCGVACYDGKVFVADSRNNRIQVRTASCDTSTNFQVYSEDKGQHLFGVGSGKGDGDGQLFIPTGIDIDPQNRLLYVVEAGNRRVSVFSCENYQFRAKFGGPAIFHKPEGIAVDYQRRIIYVCDTGTHRICMFSPVT